MSALLLSALAASSSWQGALYVDDVFSAYLYTGNGSTQTINNGIDLAGKGGLVWIKSRDEVTNNSLFTNSPAAGSFLRSDTTGAMSTSASFGGFYSAGFSLIAGQNNVNSDLNKFVSWTFRRAPKFFDVVTYTGNGVAGRQIPHGLGVAPGMIVVKQTDSTNGWPVFHRGSGATKYLQLNSTATEAAFAMWNDTAPTSSVFTVGSVSGVNANGASYIAYIFAHDPSAEGIIQCGSYTGNGSAVGPVVTLDWEPQYLMIKNASGTGNWQIIDSMRGMPVGSADATLLANLSNAESSVDYVSPTAAGFQVTSTSGEVNTSGSTYIYLAIRRPNKPPTSGTQVYNSTAYAGTGSQQTFFVPFVPDLCFSNTRNTTAGHYVTSRLTGDLFTLQTQSTSGEANEYLVNITGTNVGEWKTGSFLLSSLSGNTYINHFFRRAPGFFDVVCDTGTGAAHAIAHNLNKVPDLIIRKSRSAATQWEVWHSALAATEKLVLNSNAAKATDAAAWNSTVPTATQFTVGTGANVNANAATFVTYLFATLAGISKCGSYTGNGSSQTIDCGFSAGARFFLVKATSTTGSWWVYDSARGIVSAADPALQLNSTAAEITSADAVDPASVGIIVNQETTCSINATGVSYIFLAIA